jgi:ATP-binding cassette subfamily B protein/subfamily B ATP-binding cassette protein MsbA
MLILVYALIGAFSVTSNYVTISLGQRLVNDFRAELHAHLQRLSLAFHSRREVGDLLYRLTTDTFAIQTLTMNGVFSVLTSVVLLIGMIVVLLRLDWLLTLVSLGIVPVLMASIVWLTRRITALATDMRSKESVLWASAQPIGAIRVIRPSPPRRTSTDSSSRQHGEPGRQPPFLHLSDSTRRPSTSSWRGTAVVLWVGATHCSPASSPWRGAGLLSILPRSALNAAGTWASSGGRVSAERVLETAPDLVDNSWPDAWGRHARRGVVLGMTVRAWC